MKDIVFISIVLSIVLGPPLCALCIFLFNDAYEKWLIRTKGEKQHKMFNELKKGDFIWKVSGDMFDTIRVKNVTYDFHSDGSIRRINIITNSRYNDISIPKEKTKTFFYNDRYYTLYGEARARYNSNIIKRKQSIAELKKVTPEDIKREADLVIKRLEFIKKSMS